MTSLIRRILPVSLIILLLFQTSSAHAVSAGAAGLFSVVPGLGQVVDGEPLEGLGWFVTVVGTVALSNSLHVYAPVSGKKTAILSQAGYDLWLYNMYDAYRDGRPSGGRFSNNTALQNYAATFNPLNLVDPITTPALLAWTGGLGIPDGNIKHAASLSRPFFFGFVGMGEEGLFRGFLFPSLSDTFGSKLTGAAVSSVLFSLFHITNGLAEMESNFVQRLAMGLVFCWAADHNKYDLRHGIFAHSWIDIINESGASKSNVTQVKWNIPF